LPIHVPDVVTGTSVVAGSGVAAVTFLPLGLFLSPGGTHQKQPF